MKLTIRFDIGYGYATITTTLATLVAWERKFKMKTSDLADNFGMEDMAFMAWHSAKSQTENKLVDITIVNSEAGKVIPAEVSATP
jgi:hypothetical protein